jgi:hypothetical protein
MMLHRKKVLLKIIAELGVAATRTRVMKLAFLLRADTGVSERLRFYDFIPHKFGPYSFLLDRELSQLADNSYLSLRKTCRNSTIYQISELATRELGTLSHDLQYSVKHVVSFYHELQDRELILTVYNRFPWYASRSRIHRSRPDRAQEPNGRGPTHLFTLGYEKRTIDSILSLLLEHGVSHVCDVRSNPVSRNYGFSKNTFDRLCGHTGISYEHLPQLGIPSALRKRASSVADRPALLAHYRTEILPEQSTSVDYLVSLTTQVSTAIMCMEQLPEECHRSCLTHVVSRRTGLPIIHL